MTNYETVSGDVVRDLFDELKADKTLITLKIADQNYEKLTMLTGFRRKFSRVYFLLDCPEGFNEAAEQLETWHLKFQFTGRDKLQYSFSCRGGEFYRKQICLELPAQVSRLQRRSHFRLRVPRGSTIVYRFQESERRQNVLDVSLGGARVALVRLHERDASEIPFQPGDVIEDIELRLPAKSGKTRIGIKSATVVRIDNGLPDAKICCGLQFKEIDKDQLSALTQFIYNYQRYCLRNRLKPDL